MKKSLKKKLKLKLERFFKEQLWQHIIVVAFISACAYIFSKPIEAVLFAIAHFVIRTYFDKQYHSGKIFVCMFITCTVAFFGIVYTLPLTISLLSTIPTSCFISWIGYIVQDNIDIRIAMHKLCKQLEELLNKDIYSMTDDELYAHCRSRGLSEEECRIAHFIVIDRMKGKELYNAISYSERQTKRLRNAILNKIK